MKGKLIVLEGIDGSGKSTQYRRLCQRMEQLSRPYHSVVFPRYDQESSALVRMYLGGEFGSRPDDVNAYAASAFYAVDRFASFRQDWQQQYCDGGLILADRYTTSNACHQGSKLPDEALAAYFDWLYDFEYNRLELPCPDLVLYLDVELDVALAQMAARRRATGADGDIHEKDAAYLGQCLRAGRRAAAHYGWTRIACLQDGRMRSIEDIHEEILSHVLAVLSAGS